MPPLLYDIMRVLLLLTGPAAFVCLLNAGFALRREGGTVFWVGGGFSKWMLWAVIFLGLEPTLTWFQFFGVPVFFPLGPTIGTPWLASIQQDVSTFVSSFIVGRIAPVAAAYFVVRAVLDTASGTGPLPSILSAIFLLAISSTHALIDTWTPTGNRFPSRSRSSPCGHTWQAASCRSRQGSPSAGRSCCSPSTVRGICAW